MKKKNKVAHGGVVIIPKNTLRCNQYTDLEPAAKLVWVAMLTELWRDKDDNPNNEVKISQRTIKRLSKLSLTTIWRGTKELKKKGFVTVKPENQGGLERNTTIYTLDGRYIY